MVAVSRWRCCRRTDESWGAVRISHIFVFKLLAHMGQVNGKTCNERGSIGWLNDNKRRERVRGCYWRVHRSQSVRCEICRCSPSVPASAAEHPRSSSHHLLMTLSSTTQPHQRHIHRQHTAAADRWGNWPPPKFSLSKQISSCPKRKLSSKTQNLGLDIHFRVTEKQNWKEHPSLLCQKSATSHPLPTFSNPRRR